MTQLNEVPEVQVDEHVVLSKFDGEQATPENEVERLVIHNGLVVEHNIIENGEVVGPVEGEESLHGKEIGKLIPTE